MVEFIRDGCQENIKTLVRNTSQNNLVFPESILPERQQNIYQWISLDESYNQGTHFGIIWLWFLCVIAIICILWKTLRNAYIYIQKIYVNVYILTYKLC